MSGRAGWLLGLLAACAHATFLAAEVAPADDPGSGVDVRPAPHAAAPEGQSDWSVAHALATGPRCGTDQIVHRVQGQPVAQSEHREAICPGSPSGLDPKFGISASPLFYFDVSTESEAEAARAGYPGYVLEGWMHDVGPPDSPRMQCIYVGCTKLQVAAHGNPTTGNESCLGPLTGGTSQPSKQAMACPAAVKIGGAFRPLTQARTHGSPADADAPICCYAIPRPIPPAPNQR